MRALADRDRSPGLNVVLHSSSFTKQDGAVFENGESGHARWSLLRVPVPPSLELDLLRLHLIGARVIAETRGHPNSHPASWTESLWTVLDGACDCENGNVVAGTPPRDGTREFEQRQFLRGNDTNTGDDLIFIATV